MTHPLAERIPEDSEFRVMADSAFGAVDAFRVKIRDIKSDKRFSEQGHYEKIRDAAKSGPLAFFAELKKQIAGERESLVERRSHFELPKPDRDHVVSALDAAEIRSWLRSIENIGERIKHAASDPTIAAAVVHSPPALSGLNDDGHTRAVNFLTEHLFGDELRELSAEAEIVDAVGIAIDVAEKQLLNEFEPQGAKAA
jgi:hypothetical protein